MEEALPARIEAELPAHLEAALAPRIEAAVLARLAALASYQQPRITRTLEDWMKLDLPQVVSKELDTLSTASRTRSPRSFITPSCRGSTASSYPSAEDLA